MNPYQTNWSEKQCCTRYLAKYSCHSVSRPFAYASAFPPHSPITTACPVMSCTRPQQRCHSDTWFSIVIYHNDAAGMMMIKWGHDRAAGGGIVLFPLATPTIPTPHSNAPHCTVATHPISHSIKQTLPTGEARVGAAGEVRVARHAGAVLVRGVDEALVESRILEVDRVLLHLCGAWVIIIKSFTRHGGLWVHRRWWVCCMRLRFRGGARTGKSME